MLSIITIIKDDIIGFKSTFNSLLVQKNSNFEHVIIDASSSNEVSIFLSACSPQFNVRYINSDDKGIYDALNRGIEKVNFQFVLCLNSGDMLNNETSISRILKYIKPKSYDAYFFNWSNLQNKKFSFSSSPLRFNHQAVIYNRDLHKKHGDYVNLQTFTTADYFFFIQVVLFSKYVNIDDEISTIDSSGISSGLQTLSQVYSINYLVGRTSRISLILVLILHPIYLKVKKLLGL